MRYTDCHTKHMDSAHTAYRSNDCTMLCVLPLGYRPVWFSLCYII